MSVTRASFTLHRVQKKVVYFVFERNFTTTWLDFLTIFNDHY